MKNLRFHTNINCGNCIRAVTPTLNEVAGANRWQVDTNVPEKVLTVQSEHANAEQVMEAVREAGFEIQLA